MHRLWAYIPPPITLLSAAEDIPTTDTPFSRRTTCATKAEFAAVNAQTGVWSTSAQEVCLPGLHQGSSLRRGGKQEGRFLQSNT